MPVRRFIDDIVDHPAKQVKGRKILPGLRIKEKKGHGKGAFPNSFSGLVESGQIQKRAIGGEGFQNDPVFLGEFCPDIHYARMLA